MNDNDTNSGSPPSARGDVTGGPSLDTESGAPTDEAHKEAGDGTLAGSIPAGLSLEELRKIAKDDQSVEGGTG